MSHGMTGGVTCDISHGVKGVCHEMWVGVGVSVHGHLVAGRIHGYLVAGRIQGRAAVLVLQVRMSPDRQHGLCRLDMAHSTRDMQGRAAVLVLQGKGGAGQGRAGRGGAGQGRAGQGRGVGKAVAGVQVNLQVKQVRQGRAGAGAGLWHVQRTTCWSVCIPADSMSSAITTSTCPARQATCRAEQPCFSWRSARAPAERRARTTRTWPCRCVLGGQASRGGSEKRGGWKGSSSSGLRRTSRVRVPLACVGRAAVED